MVVATAAVQSTSSTPVVAPTAQAFLDKMKNRARQDFHHRHGRGHRGPNSRPDEGPDGGGGEWHPETFWPLPRRPCRGGRPGRCFLRGLSERRPFPGGGREGARDGC